MKQINYGYHRKILHINVTDKTYEIEYLDDIFYRTYIGNGMMAAYYLLTKTKPKIEPFDPENLLMFMSSIIAGNDAPGLARFVVAGKSPLTNGIGEARSEGPFAVALKQSGFDGIIIQGKSEYPIQLVIDNGEIRFEDATHLWGKNVNETTDMIKETYPTGKVATIGNAGENLVRFASVMSERNHAATRAGMGALMGAKNVKALVLVGQDAPQVFDKHTLVGIQTTFEKKMKDNVLSMWQHNRPGFGVWIHTHGIDASLAVNNYQTAMFSDTDAYADEHFHPYYRGESPCPSCPNNCIKRYAIDEEDESIGGLHQEAAGALGPNLGIANIEKVLRANTLCNDYGMDPNSLGYTVSFIQECVEKGLLDLPDYNLAFGDDVPLLQLVEQIAKREHIGDLLAEGSARAAKTIGKGAEKYALTVKNNEMVAFEPRSQTNLALGYAVSPTGPRYDICEHDWDYDTEFGWEHSLDYSRTVGILERIPMEYVGRKKVKNYKGLNNLWSAVDALGVSIFASAPTRVYTLDEISFLIHTITGWETSSYEVMRIGERRNHILRLYNNREGFTKEDDTLPERFFTEEIDVGPQKGIKIDADAFHDAIIFYYEMMGWDVEGQPTKATLYDHGLEALIKHT